MIFDVIDPETFKTLQHVSTWRSMTWQRGYNTEGKFLIEVENTAANAQMLAPGRYLRSMAPKML